MAADFRAVPPHDDRYGRLFPDGDVGNIIAAVIAEEHRRREDGEEPLELCEVDLDGLGAHLTFPVGEPMFLLRASNDLDLDCLLQHLDETAGMTETPEGYIEALTTAIGRFARFQEKWVV